MSNCKALANQRIEKGWGLGRSSASSSSIGVRLNTGAHQTPASEEQTPPVSSLVSQMGTATDTRVAAAQRVCFALRHNLIRLIEGVLLTGGSPKTD